MKITIERKSFVDALTIGSQMAGKSKGLSILDNAKITIKENSAIISSYDGEVAITKRTKILSHDEECVFCIEPKSLLGILRSLKDEEVKLSLDKYMCEIIHSKGKQRIPYEDAEDYPSPVIENDMNKYTLDSFTIFNWLKEAKNFVATNTLRPSLTGVYLYVGNNEYGVAATDISIMYHDKVENNEFNHPEEGAILSVKSIEALLPMINDTINVNVMFGERSIIFKTDNSMLIAAKIEQKYPNFRAIIPQKNNILANVDKNELLETVKRAMLTADEKTTLLKIEINPMSISVKSEDNHSKQTHEECLCECSGGCISIGLKGSYVLNMLNSIESDNMTMKFNAPDRPVLYVDLLNKNKILLQMPCVV